MKSTTSSVKHIFTFNRNNKFHSKSLKHTNFSNWIDGSRIYYLLHQDSYHNVYKERLPIGFLVSSTSSVMLQSKTLWAESQTI